MRNLHQLRTALGEKLPQRRKLPGHDPEERPAPTLLTFDEPCFEQHLQVVAHRRLPEPEWLGEVADAGLAVRLGLEEADDAETRWVGESLERGGQRGGLGRLERAREERRARG